MAVFLRLPKVGIQGRLKWWGGEHTPDGREFLRWCKGRFVAVSASHISIENDKTGEVFTVRVEDVREIREKP